MCDYVRQAFSKLFFACLLSLSATIASAQSYINELFFDPPGMGDLVFEYIELRGDPNASLADHYLIFLENEMSDTANPGVVEALFDLGSLAVPKFGPNGFLTLRQTGNPYTGLDPLSNNPQNTTESYGWGINSSTVGFDDEPGGTFDGIIENSGFTAMLIKNNGGSGSAPYIPSGVNPTLLDLDADDDNELDSGGILANWTVLDSIGVNSEASDINGFLYAPINFSAGSPDPNNPGVGNVPAGAVFVDVGYEIEYLGRWGNSTGSTRADWHATNVTDDGGSGFDGPADFRQAGDPHGVNTANQFVETSQGVPYGTKILGTLGSPNIYIQDGDYDPTYYGEEYVFNGVVDGSDFLAWQRNFGFGGGQYATRQHGDGDLDGTVNATDLALWEANYGTVLPGPLTAPLTNVPEPPSLMLLSFASTFVMNGRRLRQAASN
jgi:hypothetical protein